MPALSVRVLTVILGLVCIPCDIYAQRLMENLGRGVVAIHQDDDKIFVSWRVLGLDPDSIAFNVYRSTGGADAVKINPKPIDKVSFFVDEKPDLAQDNVYSVKPIVNGKEQPASGSFKIPANSKPQPYISVPVQTPEGYVPGDSSVADLDGDGEYEIVVHMTGSGRDNSQGGVTDPPIIDAYKLDGTLMWRINLGKNIREGAHYTQLMVYDLDGDGKAEVACKTADGTIDGKGKIIGDANADYRNERGYVLAGPEFLTVFSGQTGAELATANYVPTRYPADPGNIRPSGDQMKQIWGDGYGNRGDRFLACIAYLDGKLPSLVMCRGYYTRTFLTAWDWRNGSLTQRWVFDSDKQGKEFAGQGNHNLAVADVDGDGKDEIIYGAMVVDDNGKGLYSTDLGHGDAMHVSDMDPENPGLEVGRIQERFSDAGLHMYDAKTGKILWKIPSTKAATTGGDKGEGPGRGLFLDVDPTHPGYESWARGAGMKGMWDAKGKQINPEASPASCNMGIFWDGDTLSELLDGVNISKWDWKTSKTHLILNGRSLGAAANNGTKNNPCISVDFFGDWREELIARSEDNKELRIFVSTIPTEHRFYTLMHDPVYRLSIAWQNVAYNQPPHTGFYLGADMPEPPKPDIRVK